jgi:hypothetical protein
MSDTFTVTTTPAKKNTITISREQLWKNYIESWSDLAWDEYEEIGGVSDLKRIADILCSSKKLDYTVRSLFRDGNTPFLLGFVAHQFVDVVGEDRDSTLIEIIIVDNDGSRFTVHHQDIRY